ncbi:MAG: hypothetical protein J6T65_01175, partial [Clostridia bacterium]|nr:hypothetical protein [Clostridia bacterium]
KALPGNCKAMLYPAISRALIFYVFLIASGCRNKPGRTFKIPMALCRHRDYVGTNAKIVLLLSRPATGRHYIINHSSPLRNNISARFGAFSEYCVIKEIKKQKTALRGLR